MPNAGSRVGWPSMGVLAAPGGNRQFAALRQFVARDLDALQRDHVLAAAQREIVGDAHRRQQVAEVAGQLPADGGDAAQQRRVLRAFHQPDQTQAHFDRQRLDAQQRFHIVLGGRRLAGFLGAARPASRLPSCASASPPHRRRRPAAGTESSAGRAARPAPPARRPPAAAAASCRRSASGTRRPAALRSWRGSRSGRPKSKSSAPESPSPDRRRSSARCRSRAPCADPCRAAARRSGSRR